MHIQHSARAVQLMVQHSARAVQLIACDYHLHLVSKAGKACQ